MVRLKDARITEPKDRITFQFHYGTIKSDIADIFEAQEARFNSTMVRLKVYVVNVDPSVNPGFNSTMVRLKASGVCAFFSLSQFQFHYGTIKSRILKEQAPVLASFNSTMVRLKEVL